MNPIIVAGEGDAVSVLPANVVTALQQGVDKVAQGGQEGLVAILPAGLGVFGLFFGVRIAINFFKSLAH